QGSTGRAGDAGGSAAGGAQTRHRAPASATGQGRSGTGGDSLCKTSPLPDCGGGSDAGDPAARPRGHLAEPRLAGVANAPDIAQFPGTQSRPDATRQALNTPNGRPLTHSSAAAMRASAPTPAPIEATLNVPA